MTLPDHSDLTRITIDTAAALHRALSTQESAGGAVGFEEDFQIILSHVARSLPLNEACVQLLLGQRDVWVNSLSAMPEEYCVPLSEALRRIEVAETDYKRVKAQDVFDSLVFNFGDYLYNIELPRGTEDLVREYLVGRALLRQEGLDAEQIELPSEEQLNEAFQAPAH